MLLLMTVTCIEFSPLFVYLFVCFPDNISTTDAASITKLGLQMFYDDS